MTFDELVRILRRYDVPYDSNALKAALTDARQGPALAEWVETHLTPDTLLTEDQLTSYLLLERTGRIAALEQSAEAAATQPLDSDQVIRDAIDELNRSTEAISKQTETLRQQREALARLVTNSGKEGESRSELELKQLAKREADRKALSSVVEELSQTLTFRISDSGQQGKSPGGGLHQTIDGLLQSDDKLLASLQKLGWELQTEDPEEKESVDKLRETCARLIKCTVETIRTRLDRLYLEALDAHQPSARDEEVSHDEVAALQDELESLYAEILPVAQMTVEQQHLEPALKSLAAKDGQSLNHSAEAVHYIHECLHYLLDHMESLTARVETFKAHQAATSTLITTAKAELAVTIEPNPPKTPSRGAGAASPTRRRNKTFALSGVSPARQRTVSTPHRRISGGPQDAPLDQLLRELALVLPDEDDAAEAGVPLERARIEFLAGTLGERRAKATDVARNVQDSFETAAAAQVADARAALRLLRDSVLEESPYGEVNLVDPEIEGSVTFLAQETDNVRQRLAAAERDIVSVLRDRNTKREEFIARWAR